MKNLHLMSMASGFNTYLMAEINAHFPSELNRYIWRDENKFPQGFENASIDPRWFSVDYINQHHHAWDQIFLHQMFL